MKGVVLMVLVVACCVLLGAGQGGSWKKRKKRTEPSFAAEEPFVIYEMTSQNHDELLANHERVMIEFMNPSCAKCQNIEGQVKQLAQFVHGRDDEIIVAQVDCTKQGALCGQYRVPATPFFRFSKKFGAKVIPYKNEFKLPGFIYFLSQQWFKELTSEAEVSQWVDQNSGSLVKSVNIGMFKRPSDGVESDHYRRYISLVDSSDEDFLFSIVRDPEVIKALTGDTNDKLWSITRLTGAGSSNAISLDLDDGKDHPLTEMIGFVHKNSYPFVDDVFLSIPRFEQRQVPSLVALVKGITPKLKLKVFTPIAKKYWKFLGVSLSGLSDFSTFTRLGLQEPKELPVVYINNTATDELHFYEGKKLTKKSLEDFIISFFKGELTTKSVNPDLKRHDEL